METETLQAYRSKLQDQVILQMIGFPSQTQQETVLAFLLFLAVRFIWMQILPLRVGNFYKQVFKYLPLREITYLKMKNGWIDTSIRFRNGTAHGGRVIWIMIIFLIQKKRSMELTH